jgi:hypothetical protein
MKPQLFNGIAWIVSLWSRITRKQSQPAWQQLELQLGEGK